ncbi:MAG: HPF/RaiA family ribosome-associated protein [Dehalogenimonas sp.]|uniref:HPF/RaiA family ribosome-associated protein n=1 Tax=Candidatus Dehalogenimonas loeffleri TaxID=3127115 RepID=A0ABZ2J9G0_9CHLR|nr:HPF/RaiA family ribosome-associated protein [Dehalogenimonas sp.]
MDIIITARNLTLAETTRKQIERKFAKIGRHLPQARELKLEITEQATKAAKDRFIARAALDILGPVINAESRAASLPSVIDQLVAILERQAQDFKTKGAEFSRDTQRLEVPEAAGTGGKARPVVEIERYATKPMSVDEAVAALSDSRDDMMLFHNERGQVNLLRRRGDGGFILTLSEAA